MKERRSVFSKSVTTGRSTRSQRKAKNMWAVRTILGRLKTKGGLDLGGERREWVLEELEEMVIITKTWDTKISKN